MWNAGLDEAQAGIKIARKNINNLRYADNTTLVAESEEKLKSLLKMKQESEKAGFKKNEDHGIWSHHFMANRWGKSGNGLILFSWAPKSLCMVTVAMKWRCLLFGRKAMGNLDSALKSRDMYSKLWLFQESFMDVRVES